MKTAKRIFAAAALMLLPPFPIAQAQVPPPIEVMDLPPLPPRDIPNIPAPVPETPMTQSGSWVDPCQKDKDTVRYCVPRPRDVTYNGTAAPGSIAIDTRLRRLWLVTAVGRAREYAIAVGKLGAALESGTYRVYRKAENPAWYPTLEMRIKEGLPKKVPGGKGNPLGTRALYLQNAAGEDELYRIHGTTARRSIGTAASHGCFRMFNEDVEDLYDRVPVGTPVNVQTPPHVAPNSVAAARPMNILGEAVRPRPRPAPLPTRPRETPNPFRDAFRAIFN